MAPAGRTFVAFLLFCLGVQLFMSYDGGATPASIDQILDESGLNWTQAELGLLGSLDKFAMTASSLLWGRALQLVPAKVLLTSGLALNSVSTLVFGSVKAKPVMYVAKALMGVSQSLQCVWCTCWVLTRAPEASRTVWLGLLAVAAGIGNGIGTAVAGFGTSQGLPYAFAWRVEAACLAALWLLMLLSSSELLTIDKSEEEAGLGGFSDPLRLPPGAKQRAATAGNALCDMKRLTADSAELEDAATGRSQESRLQLNLRRSVSHDEGKAALLAKGQYFRKRNVELVLSVAPRAHVCRQRFMTHCDNNVPVVLVKSDVAQQFKDLVKNPVYVWTAFALAAVMFVVSGIQFLWVRLFTQVWGLKKNVAVSGFLICTGLGGALGTFVGPKAIDASGGFHDAKGRATSMKFISSMHLVSSCGAVSSACALLAKLTVYRQGGNVSDEPQAPDALLYAMWSCIFVVFAACNATQAGLTGINVSAVDEHMMSLASGCTLSLQNLLGFAMGPLLPGAVMDTVFVDQPRDKQLGCGFAVVLAGCATSLLCSSVALAASRGQTRDRQSSVAFQIGSVSSLVVPLNDRPWTIDGAGDEQLAFRR